MFTANTQMLGKPMLNVVQFTTPGWNSVELVAQSIQVELS